MTTDVQPIETFEATDTVHFTDAAREMVESLLMQKSVPNHGLRVFVAGGGCSGLQYGMALEAEPRPMDHVMEQGGFRVFVDFNSMLYLAGATVDYEDSLMGGGFRIENPNAVSSCGCGSSFKTKDTAGAATATGGGCGCD